MSHSPKAPSAAPATSHAAAGTPPLSPRTVDSQALLGPHGVLYIRHQGEVYRLQTTRFGKLLLTK